MEICTCVTTPLSRFLGGAWGVGMRLHVINDAFLGSPHFISLLTQTEGRGLGMRVHCPQILVIHHGLHYTHCLGRVVGRGNWVGDVDHPRLSWSWRNPPTEEVLKTLCEFQWFRIRQNLSQSGSVRCLLGASWTVKECLLFDHSLWWGSSDMGPCWVSFLQFPVRSSCGTTPVPAVQLEVQSQICQQILVGRRW